MRARAVVVGLLVLTLGSFGPAPAGADHNTASIGGRVTGQNGEPLAGICVELYGEGGYTALTTDGSGSYRANALFPGDYLVGFNTCPEPVSGRAGEFFDDAAGFTDATAVPLAEGEIRNGVDAALEPAATISGRLTDEDRGTALSDDCVIAFEEDRGIFGVTRTDPDGRYTIGNLRAGEYLVAFADCSSDLFHISRLYDGTPDLPVPLGGTPLESEPVTVVLEDGESVTGIDESMLLGGSVAGTITARHTGQPVDFTCVGLYSAEDEIDDPDGQTFTGFRPDGQVRPGGYVFDGVLPDDYAVGYNIGQLCGDDGYDSGWAVGKSQRQDADVVTVRRGELAVVGNLVLSPRPGISAVCPGDRPADFRDVPRDSVHSVAIGCMFDFGIALGPGDGTYRPSEPVRRGQMATFIAATLEVLGFPLPEEPFNAFDDDDDSVHSYAIDQLRMRGIVAGKDFRTFAPDEPVSRAQMTTFLVRAYEAAASVALVEDGNVYADDEGSTHEGNINRAAAAALTAGTGSGGFGPAQVVRRDQMATFVARLIDRVVRDDVTYDPSTTRVVGSPSSSRTTTGSTQPDSAESGSTESGSTATGSAQPGPGSALLRGAPLGELARRVPHLAPLLDRPGRLAG